MQDLNFTREELGSILTAGNNPELVDYLITDLIVLHTEVDRLQQQIVNMNWLHYPEAMGR